MNHEIAPDSLMLRQVDGYWQRLAALILWKTSGHKRVTITADDIKAMTAAFEAEGGATVLTHGHADSIEFGLISAREAHRLAIEEAKKAGNA